ncbi:hypothetical protein NM688_g2514 [Phlebia brevispora]|uniref:Uncharacterized protein n=1 Tax=Phlebia brevispora TaxID=194682 RepID=A0ACC1T8G9_9APHY|nr:hypothetical protein NM688_g2514 [Phlebia brevispora]
MKLNLTCLFESYKGFEAQYLLSPGPNKNMAARVPAEIWISIFRFAVAAQSGLDITALPMATSPSFWTKGFRKEWVLRTPLDDASLLHRQRNTTLKSIVCTCRFWRQLGAEFLLEYLYFQDPANVIRLCAVLDSDRHPGRYIRRLHIARFHERFGFTLEELQMALVSIIQHSHKLQIFIMEWPLRNAFASAMDALCTYSARSLQTLHVYIPQGELAKLIWTLDTLPCLLAVHLEFTGTRTEDSSLGAASNIVLTLPRVHQLTLRGFASDFVDQAVDWSLPSLRTLTLDFTTHRDDLPDILEFLRSHGSQLTFLDVDCIPEQDVRPILDFCPALETFAFNGDWRLPLDDAQPHPVSAVVHQPHPTITTIGLHGMHYAFGVGTALQAPFHVSAFHCDSNDFTFFALQKHNFPKLERIRLLSSSLLQHLEEANGPKGDFRRRWERWWIHCSNQEIRLEDCTGAELGDLPVDEEDYSDTGSEAGEVESVSEMALDDPIARIRALTERCRQMTASLQYPYPIQ